MNDGALTGDGTRRVMADANSAKYHTPYRFEGMDYYSPSALAAAWAENGLPWENCADTMGYLNVWFESNFAFNSAVASGESADDAELALFRFVHGAASLPFCLMGQTADMTGLYAVLCRAARGEASKLEARIAEMLDGGRLASFYEEYARHNAPDGEFHSLLRFLTGKGLWAQIDFIYSILNPGAYVLPDDAENFPGKGRVTLFETIGAPVRREVLENLAASYILPDALYSGFKTAASYRASSERLGLLSKLGLFIAHGTGEHYKGLSLDAYELAARELRLGQAPGFLERCEQLASALEELGVSDSDPSYPRIIGRMRQIGEKTVTRGDTEFVDDMLSLLSERSELRAGWRRGQLIMSAGGFGVFAALRMLGSALGFDDAGAWTTAGVLSMLAAIAAAFWTTGTFRAFARGLSDIDAQRHNSTAAVLTWRSGLAYGLLLSIFWVIGRAFGMALDIYSYRHFGGERDPAAFWGAAPLFSLSGVLWGASAGNARYNRKAARNLSAIKETCEAHLFGIKND